MDTDPTILVLPFVLCSSREMACSQGSGFETLSLDLEQFAFFRGCNFIRLKPRVSSFASPVKPFPFLLAALVGPGHHLEQNTTKQGCLVCIHWNHGA